MANSSSLWSRLHLPASPRGPGHLTLHRFGFADLGRDITTAAQIDLFADPMKAWTRNDITRSFSRDGCSGLIATLDGAAAGYVLHRPSGGVIEVTRIAVAVRHQRYGVGRGMIDGLLLAMDDQKRTCLVARVPLANLGACYFLARCGFRSRLAEFTGGEDVVGFTSRPRCYGK